MNESRITERLSWWSTALVAKRVNVANLLLRLKEFGVRAGTSLALHRKFIHLLEQVSFERDKEREILDEIEAVEKLHREMKRRKLLRQAAPDLAGTAGPFLDEGQEKKPRRINLWKVFALLYMFSPPKKERNDRGPTPSVD